MEMYVYSCHGAQSTHSNIGFYGLMYIKKTSITGSQVRGLMQVSTRGPFESPLSLTLIKTRLLLFLWPRCLPAVREQTEQPVPLSSEVERADTWKPRCRRQGSSGQDEHPHVQTGLSQKHWRRGRCVCEWERGGEKERECVYGAERRWGG